MGVKIWRKVETTGKRNEVETPLNKKKSKKTRVAVDDSEIQWRKHQKKYKSDINMFFGVIVKSLVLWSRTSARRGKQKIHKK